MGSTAPTVNPVASDIPHPTVHPWPLIRNGKSEKELKFLKREEISDTVKSEKE